jgi:gliding motility-associated-like protein
MNEGIETIIVTFNQNVCNYPTQTDTLFIDNHQPIQIINQNINLTCPSDVTVISAIFTGGYPPFSYSWSTGSTADSIIVSPSVTSSYTLTVSDTCGPSTDTDTITVNVPAFSPLTVESTDAVINCPGTNDTVAAIVNGGFGPYTYVWTLNSNLIGSNQSQIITPGAGSVYVVTVEDACGTAPAQDTVAIIQLPYQLPQVLGVDASVQCPGDIASMLALTNFGRRPYVYSWSNGMGGLNDSIISYSATQTSTIAVTVTDACNNTSSPDSVRYVVPTYQPVSVLSRADTTVCPGFVLNLPASATGGSGTYSYSWNSNADPITQSSGGEGTVTVNSSGIYTLTATDDCQNSDIVTINIEMLPGCEVDEVNVFTPNGDGKNENLVFKSLEYFPNSKLVIFNRWGEKVYENDNYKNDWNGENMHSGTYYYNLTIPNSETKTGFFKLMK